MILERKAPAKVNLGLHVLRKRPDGYHSIETVLLRLNWCDILAVSAADGFRFSCSDPSLPVDASNLCVEAALMLADLSGSDLRLSLHLDKRLPHGAGLGGGSSDAANTLLLLKEYLNLQTEEHALRDIAAELGSDVPFFLGEGAALATGRGEKLEALLDGDRNVYTMPFELVVVVPPVQVSTAEAYRHVSPSADNRPALDELVRSNDLSRWRKELVNDFEPSVFEAYPMIAEIKDRLLDLGAGYAALSGSGSAVFGVFERKEDARDALRYFDRQNMIARRD